MWWMVAVLVAILIYLGIWLYLARKRYEVYARQHSEQMWLLEEKRRVSRNRELNDAYMRVRNSTGGEDNKGRH